MRQYDIGINRVLCVSKDTYRKQYFSDSELLQDRQRVEGLYSSRLLPNTQYTTIEYKLNKIN